MQRPPQGMDSPVFQFMLALLECENAYAAHKGADAVLLAAQEAGRSLRAQIDALRTLAANQRAAITYSEGVGR